MINKILIISSWWMAAIVATVMVFSMTSNLAQAGGLEDSIPMSSKSWKDVLSYKNTLNDSYIPSPKIQFKHKQPQLILSEKTAVDVLNSVRDSLEDDQGVEPWVFDFVIFSCGLPCDGT